MEMEEADTSDTVLEQNGSNSKCLRCSSQYNQSNQKFSKLVVFFSQIPESSGLDLDDLLIENDVSASIGKALDKSAD